MKNLKHVDETYVQHLPEALLTAGVAIAAGVICLVHAIFPFLFAHTASDMLHWIIKRHSARTGE